MGTPATELRLPTRAEQVPADAAQRNAYLMRSAELNTQRSLSSDEAEDLLADQRENFIV